MGLLTQLGLLFKKNVILRKRQPGIVVLEIVWPVLIVAVVAIIRQGVPIGKRDTCHYQERAMPSVGMVPFLQTFVCNLDNQCHSTYTLNRAKETTYSVSKLVQQLAPTLSSDDVLDGLKAMEQGVEMIDALINMANDTDVLEGLDSMLQVRSFFRDPNYVKEILVARYKVMDEEQAEAMLDATVNITLIFELIGYPDFRGVACDPAELSKYLLFKTSVDVREVSASICNISVDKIPEITNFLQSQFDIAQLVRIMGKFERVKQRLGRPYTSGQAFSDIADMIDLALQSPYLISTIKSISSIQELPDLIRNLPKMIEKINEFGYFDMSPFVKLVRIIDPVVEAYKPNDTIWYAVKYGVLMAADISDIAQNRINGSMTDVINRLLHSAQQMGTSVTQLIGAMGQDLQMVFGAFSQVDWTSIYDQLVNQTVDTQATVKSLKDLQASLQGVPEVWNVTAPVVMVISRFMEMGTIILQETNNLERVLMDMVNKAGPTQTALNSLFSKGPNITLAVLSAFTDSKALAKLFESPFSYQDFCNSLLNDVSSLTGPQVASELRPVMCSNNISTSINNLVASLRVPEVQGIMNDTVSKLQGLFNGHIPTADANFTMLFLRSRDMAESASAFVDITGATWRNLVSSFRLENIDLTQRQWEPVLDQLNENYVASAILAMIRGVGVAMDSGNLSPMIGQYIHMAQLITKYSYTYMNSYVELYSTSSPLAQLVQLMTTYAPEMIRGVATMTKDPQQIIEIVSIPDPMVGMCTWFQRMPVPSYVPLDNMTNIVCNEIPKVLNNIVTTQNQITELTQQLSLMWTDSPGTVYSVENDWTQVLDYTERMMDMMKQPGNILAILEGPGNLISIANFSRMDEAMAALGDVMKTFSYKDAASMVDINLGLMHQLDASLQNLTEWRIIKQFILTWDVYIKLVNNYYKAVADNSISAVYRNYPPDLRNYIDKMAAVTPDFIDALKNAILSPEKLIRKLFDSPTGLVAPDCSSHWVMDFLMVSGNSSLRDFERMTCALNWTAVGMDLIEADPYMQAYMNQVNLLGSMPWSMLPNPQLNWTEVMIDTEHYMMYLTNQALDNMGSFNFAPFNVSAIDMKWTEFLNAVQSLQNFDMQKLNELMTTIQMSLEKLGMSQMGNMTGELDNLVLNSLYANTYITHHFITFINKVLTYFNTHHTVNLLDYMGSDELRKTVRVMELNPQLSEIGLDSIIAYLMDPSKFSVFVNLEEFGTQLCTNVTFFTTVFDVSGATSDPGTIQSALCNSAAMNYSVLYDQLRQNWDGFADLADAIIRLSHDQIPPEELRMNISVTIADQNTLNYLINQTIYNPPTITITTNNDWMNMTIYASQWETFLHQLNTTLVKYQDPGFMSTWQRSVTKVLSNAYLSIPGFDTTLRYMDVILDVMEKQLKQSLESLPDAFRPYPNLSKMLSLVNRLPEAFLVVSYTDLVHPEKVAKWSQAMMSWESFCTADSTQLFAMPPGVQFSMENFLREMCEINITNLVKELEAYEGTDRLNALLANPNSTMPVNITAIAGKMASLIDTLTSLSTAPMSTGWDLRIFNQSIWMNVINKLAEYANSTANAYSSLSNLQTTLTQTMLSSFQGIPGFNMVFSYMDVILDIITDQIQRSLVSLPEAFRSYPNMYKILQLLDDLPSMFEVVSFTNFLTPRKISKWGAAMASWEGFCSTDVNTLMTVPPNMNFNLSAFIQTMCSINITALTKEAEQYQGTDRIMALINSGNTNVTVNSTAVIAKLTNIINMFTQNASSLVMPQSQPSAFNESVWMDVFGRINKYIESSNTNFARPASIFAMAQDLFSAIPELTGKLGGLDTVMAVVETILDRIIRLENATSFAPRDIFPDSPQLQALIDIIEEPGVIPVLLNSLNSQKMMPLFAMTNVTEVFMALCMPGADISIYLSVPVGFTVDMTQLQTDFCDINVTALEPEVNAAFDVPRITRVAQGTEHIDWMKVGEKVTRVTDMISNWVQNPPKVILPPNWENETYWLDLLQTYNMARQTPEAINAEIENMLIKMGPLLTEEPFRQYGVVMETVLRLLNQNIIAMQNITMTVTTMFEKVPILHDVITALGLRADVLEALMTAPVKNPKLFTQALVQPDSPSFLCKNGDIWKQLLVLPPDFDTSALTSAVCNTNTSAIVANLVRNLDLESVIAGFSNMSVTPDWQAIFRQSQELGQNINNLIQNPPTFKVNESLALLEKAYNQSNLWNMIISYNVLAQAFSNNSEFQGVDMYMRGAAVVVNFLNDIFQKMGVNGVTLDLGSLFQGSPTFTRLVNTILHLSPDPITGLASIQLKPSQNMAFSMVAADPNQLTTVFCNENNFRHYFDVAPGFNLSSVLPVLCTMNFTQMASELDSNFMVSAMIAKMQQIGSQPFDIQNYITSVQELNNKIMELIGVKHVMFGNTDLEQVFRVNTSALMEVFQQQSVAMQTDYQAYINTAFGALMQSLGNTTEWRTVAVSLKIFDIYLKYLNQNLRSISGHPLSLALLVNNTEIGSFLLPLMSDPLWLDQLLQLQLKPDKLQEMLRAPNATSAVCSRALWDAFVTPTNGTSALEYLQQRLCSLNSTVLMWQSIAVSAQGYQFYQQMMVLTKELQTGGAMVNLNTTELSQDLLDTVQLVTGFINSLMNSTLSAENFFNVGGFQSVLNNLQGTLNQRLLDLSSELSSSMANLIWPQIPDQNVANTMARVINTIKIFMTVINDKLVDIKDGNLTLQTLSGNHPALLSLMEAYINVTKFGLQAWMDGEIHLERVIQLMSDQSAVTSRCQDGSVAAFISNTSAPSIVARNLQTVICTYMTDLPNEFRNLVDYQRIHQQMTTIWNSTGTVTPDFAGYTAQVQRFNQLLVSIAQSNIQVSKQLSNIFDFSNILRSLNNLAKDPTMIFQLLKPLGLALNGPMQDPYVRQILSGIDTYMILPITKYLEILKENGLSFASMFSDPSQILKAVGVFGNYNTQMGLSLVSFAKPLYQNVAKNTGFINAYLCNRTVVNSYFTPLVTPAIANVLCNENPTTWISKLTELGVGNVEQYGLAVKMMTALSDYTYAQSCYTNCTDSSGDLCYTSCSATSSLLMVSDVTWVQLLTDMEKMTKLFMDQTGGAMNMNHTAMAAVNSITGLWDNLRDNFLANIIQSAFGSMKMVDLLDNSQEWNKFKHMLHFVGSVNKYLNNMIEKFTNSSSEIYLQDVFPDSGKVAKLLSGLVGQDTAAEFLTAAFNPVKFYEKMSDPRYWQIMLCDYSQFSMTFTFPPGTNVMAIQQAMCNMVRNQSSSVDQLVELFGAGSVLSEFESLMSSQPTNLTLGWSLWDTVYNSTIRLLNNLDKLQKVKVNGTSANQWFAPILAALQALQNPTQDMARSEATCNELISYVRDTDMFRQARPFIVEAIGYMKLFADQLKLSGVADDVVCAMTRDLDLNKALDLLKSAGFWDSLTQSNYLVNINGSEQLQCSIVIQTSQDMWTAINDTIWGNSMMDWNKMGQCFQEGSTHFRTILTGMDSVLQIATDLIPILQEPALKQLLGNQESLAPVLDFILRVFAQQRTVLLKFSDLLKNESSVEMYLLEVARLSPELISSLLKSSINLDAANFLNQPVEEIRDTLCNATRLEQVITLPNFTNINVAGLSRLLCTNLSLETATALKSAAEATVLIEQILAATQTGLDQAFFNNISTHIFNLVGDLQSISEIASIFSQGFDINALKGNIPQIDRFLMSSGPERIVRSLTDILEDVMKVMPQSSEANTVLKEIDIFIRGFIGLDIVQSYFLEALTVVDFLENPTTVYNYLVNVVGMTPNNAQTVLEGVFSIRVFLNSSYLLDKDIKCTDMFSQLIILNSTTMTTRQITDDLCRVNESVAIKIANLLIPQLTIGDLVKRYVSLSADDIFKSANITASEATALATKLSNAQNDLLKAADILTGKSTTLNLKSNELLGELFNLPQAQTGPNTMGSIQPLLCGKKPGDLAGDDFNVGSVLGSNSKATLDKDEIDELSQADKDNGGDFCQKMYRDIKDQDLGSIIWAYLKPIMRGKIVYTPDTPLSRRIIEQTNSVFRTMKKVQEVAKVWSSGAPNLMLMSEKSQNMGNLKDVLKNDFIASLLKQTAGLDTKELLSGLDALNSGNFNSSSIKGMKVAADLVVNYTSCMEMNRFIPKESEEELEKEAFKLAKTNNFLAGIVFTNIPKNSGRKKRAADEELPKHIQYTIRMESENVRPTSRLKARYWQPSPDDNFASDMQYLRGFMQLQDMIERAIVTVQTGDNTTLPGAYLKQFPFPCTTSDQYIGVLGSYLLPVVMTFAWLAALAIATRNLVRDRENGHEETMKIMGMKPFFNWFAWLISTLFLMVIVSAILMMILKVSKLFNMSDPTIIFLYLVCFCVSTTMMCYFVSAFFTRVTLAILMVLIVYFLTYLPYVVLVSMEVSMTFWQKTLACLFSTSAFGFAAQYLARLEIQNIGLQWSNIATSPINGDPMTFSWACYMMLIDSAIYLILGWYIRSVMPGKYGIAEPWYFPVLPSYWCGKLRNKEDGLQARTRQQNITLFESSISGGIPGMALRDLTKKFGGKTVVDNISMDFYEGQVTALLGHNGASKTTTMNMLIGLLQPTSGEVYINKKGKSGNIGYCPQHNTLLDYMTVMEHMELYSGVKCDWSAGEKANEIRTLLRDVDLFSVRHVRVNQLSGGMKRRLCVALAFVGGSTSVILDEPTSGVDPHARKHIWNLIVKQRLERTILLSTHHLDEADTLGDTVAIMHKGHILCCGSPIFLKEKLGGGYHLTADKAIRQEADGGYNGNLSNCNSQDVLAFIQRMLPQAQLVEEVGTEMIFNLPRDDSAHTPFSTFFTELDRNIVQLNISSYGVSDTTLEDVFLKVTALADDEVSLSEDVLEKERLKLTRNRSDTETQSDTTSESSSQETSVNILDKNSRYSGLSLKLQQMSALLLKRLHHYKRNWRMFLSIVLLPTILFVASMGFAKIRPSTESLPKLMMTPDLYAPNNYMFYKDMSYETLSDRLARSLVQKPGVGTVCMDGFDSGLSLTCDLTNRNFTQRVPRTDETGVCVCKEHKHECPPGISPIPRQIETPTGNYLQDLLGEDIPSYLLNSFDQFLEKRYGGWSYEVGPEGTEAEMATTIWYNNRGYHSMPAFFNAYSNSLLRAKIGQTPTEDPSKYGITAYNHPFTFNTMKLSLNSLGTEATDAGIALVFLLAFTFIPSAFMVFLVNENINKEKQLQFISGVGSTLYWTTSYLWDLLVYSFTVAIAVAVLAIFQIGPYWDRMNLASLVVLLLLYGWAVLPMMYMTLKLFKSASSAYLILFCLNMLIGILSVITIFTLIIFESLGMKGITYAYEVCRYLFLIFPQFCLGQGLIDLAKNHFKYSLFIRFGEDTYENPLSFELMGWNLVALGIEGLVFFFITIFIESRHGGSTKIPRRLLEIADEDDDVRNERNRIQMGHTKDDILCINGLTKMYRHGLRKFLAVDNISFGVSKGECFGLLGVNGAGKTTTFRMLTGDTSPSSGDAFLNGNKISKGDPCLGQEVGYCPQDGGLDDYLSGEELLFCHARLKGMSDDYAKKAIADLVGKLRLAEYAQKAIKTYSGGTKRKLSLAIAMLGEPPVLFLDEPTTGMDPATRRLVWKCITKAGQRGQSLVLTSHSMDECDALCSRLAIMVNGRLMCLGSAQHLKSKFGDGYTVIMHIQGLSSNRYNIEQAFLTRFPGAMVKVSVDGKDQHQSVLEVSIPRGASSVAELFSILQTAQAKNHITRYSLSQTTLDTVFVNFARDQSDSVSDNDNSSTNGSASDQSGMLAGPFTNQTYAYMNPQYMADPEDVRFSAPSQYAANLSRASKSMSASFKGDKQKEAFKGGMSNPAFSDEESTFTTRL